MPSTPEKSAGFDGPILEPMLARWAQGLGHPAHIKDWTELRASYSGSGFTLSMSGGWSYGYGVAEWVEPQDVTFTPAASGTRWDTLVIRKDYTATYSSSANTVGGTTVWKILEGTDQKTVISGGTGYVPGVTLDSAAYLVPVTATGLGTPERIQMAAGSNLWSESTAFPGDCGIGTVSRRLGRSWLRAPDPSTGAASWQPMQQVQQGSLRLTKAMFGGGWGGSTTVTVNSPQAGFPFVVQMTAALYMQMFYSPQSTVGTATVTVSSSSTAGSGPNTSGRPRYAVCQRDQAGQQVESFPTWGVSYDGSPVTFTITLATTGESVMVESQALSQAAWIAHTF